MQSSYRSLRSSSSAFPLHSLGIDGILSQPFTLPFPHTTGPCKSPPASSYRFIVLRFSPLRLPYSTPSSYRFIVLHFSPLRLLYCTPSSYRFIVLHFSPLRLLYSTPSSYRFIVLHFSPLRLLYSTPSSYRFIVLHFSPSRLPYSTPSSSCLRYWTGLFAGRLKSNENFRVHYRLHLYPLVWDILLPLAQTPDRRDHRLLVSIPKDTGKCVVNEIA